MPQIQELISSRQKVKEANSKLLVAKNNLDILTNLRDHELDDQLKIVESALPQNKDFNAVLNTLSLVSGKTGIYLGNFSFKVGDLSEVSNTKDKYLFFKLDLTINGDLVEIGNFINALNNAFPLSQVVSVSISKKDAAITVVFYYKPLPPIAYSGSLPLSVISKSSSLLQKLIRFDNSQKVLPLPQAVISSKSASFNPL